MTACLWHVTETCDETTGVKVYKAEFNDPWLKQFSMGFARVPWQQDEDLHAKHLDALNKSMQQVLDMPLKEFSGYRATMGWDK